MLTRTTVQRLLLEGGKAVGVVAGNLNGPIMAMAQRAADLIHEDR